MSARGSANTGGNKNEALAARELGQENKRRSTTLARLPATILLPPFLCHSITIDESQGVTQRVTATDDGTGPD